MHNHITIHKHNLFPLGEDDGDPLASVVIGVALYTIGKRRHRDDHIGCHDARRTVQTLGEEGHGSCPSLVDSTLKGLARSLRPEIAIGCPSILLEESAELIVAKPEQAEVCVIPKGVLGASHALHALIVEPVDIGMGVPGIPNTAVDVPTVHRPEVRQDVQISLYYIGTDIRIDKRRSKTAEHW